jgi:hypothetical protein
LPPQSRRLSFQAKSDFDWQGHQLAFRDLCPSNKKQHEGGYRQIDHGD